jgi:hypothetical protein
MTQLYIVTGAFGYSGKYIAARLKGASHAIGWKPTANEQRPHKAGFVIDRRRLPADAA